MECMLHGGTCTLRPEKNQCDTLPDYSFFSLGSPSLSSLRLIAPTSALIKTSPWRSFPLDLMVSTMSYYKKLVCELRAKNERTGPTLASPRSSPLSRVSRSAAAPGSLPTWMNCIPSCNVQTGSASHSPEGGDAR